MANRGLRSGAATAEFVQAEIPGDGDQPGGERRALPGERVDAAQRADEHLLGQVLDQVSVARTDEQNAVRKAIVLETEGGER